MEIQVQKIIDTVDNNELKTLTVTKTAAAIKKEGFATAFGQLFDNFEAQAADDSLVQANLVIESKIPATFRLETNVINLPLQDRKKLFQFFDLDGTAAVNVYLIVVADNINISHLRIDEMASVADLVADSAAVKEKIVTAASEKWEYLQTAPIPERPSAVKATTKTATTKAKATTKKNPRKKATRAKTTKRASTKTAAVKKTTAAKTAKSATTAKKTTRTRSTKTQEAAAPKTTTTRKRRAATPKTTKKA